MTHTHIRIFPDTAALAEAAALYIVGQAQAAVAARGRFTIALSGGSTPKVLYEHLLQGARPSQFPWNRTYVFWSDERAVPLDDPRSNYRMAYETLLQHVPLPKEHMHPMLSNGDDLDSAAQHYERVIQGRVPGMPPRFDLLLLGLGPDGHTGSIFPHSPVIQEQHKLVAATPVAPLEPPVRRITFTAPLINAAAEVLFLVAGVDKAQRLQQVIEGPRQPEALPAQLVAPTDGALIWMLEQGVAQQLSQDTITRYG